MLKDVAADLAAQLEGAGLGLTEGTNLFVGEIPADETTTPGKAVFLIEAGGTNEPLLGGQRAGIAEPVVQARVRGDREGFQAGDQFARDVFAALHLTQPTGYISVQAREARPFYLGSDAAGRPLFTVNLLVRYRYAP